MKRFPAFRMGMEYLRHLLNSDDKHSIHSPFIFEFYTKCVIASRKQFGDEEIESLRLSLENDSTQKAFVDPGNGYITKTTIKKIAKRSSKSPRLSRLLAAMVRHFQPSTALELGTSLGLSSLYQWKMLPKNAMLWTLEGNSSLFPYAQKHFNQFGCNNVKLVPGKFSDTLPKVLSEIENLDWAFIDGHHQYQATIDYYELLVSKLTEQSVLVFDDINWSEGMQRAWKEIIAKPEVTSSVDLFFFGIVFFNKGLSKETFKLRL